jgi:hypothetical protein
MNSTGMSVSLSNTTKTRPMGFNSSALGLIRTTSFALTTALNVFNVCATADAAGDNVAQMIDSDGGVSESWRYLVKMEDRQGMCSFRRDACASASAARTFDHARRDLSCCVGWKALVGLADMGAVL